MYNIAKLGLLAGVSFAGLLSTAVAQEAQDNDTSEMVFEEITVSASRIKNSSFDAPTPVSTISDELIGQRGTTNIANIINEMPAFTGTITAASTNLNSRQNGINALDLRGLGTNRNLVMVNGRRVTPFDEFANIDINSVPSLAIDRVEVVTGGASAAWGSDAVSGVVNLIFDEDLDGVKLNAQYGQSDEGDAEDYRVSAAWGGYFSDERGHFMVAADYNNNKGIPRAGARAWQRKSPAFMPNAADTGPNDGIPQFVFNENTVLFLGSPNGVTLPLGTAADNLEFLPDGTVIPRELGQIGGNFMVGGSGSQLGNEAALLIPLERFNVMGTARYDIQDNLTVFAEASYAQSESLGALVNAFSFGDVVIMPDNAYLPDSVAALNTPFPLFRTFHEFPPISSQSKNENMRLVGGVKGEFASSWTWEVSGQYGETNFTNNQPYNLLPGNLVLAADAVYDPVADDIVCRANLGGANGAPGCVPINLFGQGSPSAAAIDYVTGTGLSETKIQQTVFAADMGGEVFDAWAGPLLASIGVEYRKEELNRTVNDLNDNEEFLIVNAQPLSGEFDVKEGFLEIGMPLISGDQSLDFNGAVRYTDYSTVGEVITWKAGLVYSPIEELRFRGSVSKDIRAPSIGETFVETVLLFDSVTNPYTGNEDFIQSPTTGNTGLKEESAITTTVGVVYASGGLKLSLDWYRIDLDDAIGTLGSQEIVNRCHAGEVTLCDLITFAPDNTITRVTNQNLNLGTFEMQGIDFEGRYSFALDEGSMSLGLVVSYLIEKNIAPSGGEPIDVAGDLGPNTGYGTPDLRANFSVAYDTETWGAYAQLRYIGDGVYDPRFGPEQLSDADNKIGAVAYVDLSAKYSLEEMLGSNVEVYAGIDNVFDRDPPVIPLDFISNLATNANHYDVIGRKFYFGVRAEF